MDYDEAGVIPGQKKDVLSSKQPHHEEHTLVEGLQTKSKEFFSQMILQTSSSLTKFLESWFGIVNAHHYFFLALLGAITAAVCFLTDLCTVYLIDCKKKEA